MKPRRLSGLDAAFLATQTRWNQHHLMSVMVFDPETMPGGYSFEGLRDFISGSLEYVPPLCRRVVEVPFGLDRPVWVDALPLDLDLHVRRAALPSPGGRRELAALASQLNRWPLDRSRPLWEMVVVEGLADDRIAIVAKLHHCMMDGGAGMQWMGSLFSRTPELGRATQPAKSKSPGRAPSELRLLADALPVMLSRPLRIARAAGHTLAATLRSRWEMSGELRNGETAAPVPRTPLNEPTTPNRAIAYTAVALEDVKRAGRSFGATVNEVILALISGALRRYLDVRGVLPETSLVAGVPASLREGENDERANAYFIMRVELATHIADPVSRLTAIREGSRRAKRKKDITGGAVLSEWTEALSPLLLSLIARAHSDLGLAQRIPPFCNLIVSSLAGPPVPLYFGGARLLDLYPLSLLYDGMGLNVTALSCEERLDLGLVTCRERMPDLWEFTDSISDALTELLRL